MFNRLRLVIAIIVVLFVPTIVFAKNLFAQDPICVKDFKLRVRQLDKISGGQFYKYPQPSLEVLEETGRGDCVAWAKLLSKVTISHNVDYEYLTVYQIVDEGKDPEKHRVSTFYDRRGQRWAQSCTEVRKIDDLNDVVAWMNNALKDKWPRGCYIHFEK